MNISNLLAILPSKNADDLIDCFISFNEEKDNTFDNCVCDGISVIKISNEDSVVNLDFDLLNSDFKSTFIDMGKEFNLEKLCVDLSIKNLYMKGLHSNSSVLEIINYHDKSFYYASYGDNQSKINKKPSEM